MGRHFHSFTSEVGERFHSPALEKPPSSPQGEVVQYIPLKVRVRGTPTRFQRDYSAQNSTVMPVTPHVCTPLLPLVSEMKRFLCTNVSL